MTHDVRRQFTQDVFRLTRIRVGTCRDSRVRLDVYCRMRKLLARYAEAGVTNVSVSLLSDLGTGKFHAIVRLKHSGPKALVHDLAVFRSWRKSRA